MALEDKLKEKIADKEFLSDVFSQSYSRRELTRVYAVKRTFSDVDFSQCSFTSCYFRNCRFIRCNFTGTNFKETNLRGSTYPESIFKYTTFDKSPVDAEILDNCLPPEENLARDLVQSLRVNFAQIGNYEAVNKAISIEVKQTGQHLYNAAYSKQSYYRGKEEYAGINRILYVWKHFSWKFLDILWGNGESIVKILFSAIFFVIASSLLVYIGNPEETPLKNAFLGPIYAFWGVSTKFSIGESYMLLLTVGRLIFFSLFISVLIKRLARR